MDHREQEILQTPSCTIIWHDPNANRRLQRRSGNYRAIRVRLLGAVISVVRQLLTYLIPPFCYWPVIGIKDDPKLLRALFNCGYDQSVESSYCFFVAPAFVDTKKVFQTSSSLKS